MTTVPVVLIRSPRPYNGQVGSYAADQGTIRLVVTGVRCPYCETFMSEVKGGHIVRVVEVLGEDAEGFQGRGVPVPATHRVLSCLMCHHDFTQPR